MILSPQAVYLAIDFVFQNGNSKPKYFVVLHCDEDSYLLVSLTTSQSKLPSNLDQPGHKGCVYFNDNRGYGHSFVILSTDIIGKNNFNFPASKTYIQWEMRSQISVITADKLSSQITRKVKECCVLTDDTYRQILDCLLKSRYISRKHREQISQRIESLK